MQNEIVARQGDLLPCLRDTGGDRLFTLVDALSIDTVLYEVPILLITGGFLYMQINYLNEIPTKHGRLVSWVKEWAELMTPEGVYWCDGSKAEYERLSDKLVSGGLATRLNPAKRPNCLLFRSDPSDVARVETRTYVASEKQEDAGPLNNWIEPEDLKKTMRGLYRGCMKGRIMYVIPFSMGPVGSNIAKIGFEITDSAYVVINMHIMARVTPKVYEVLGTDGEFIPSVHSVGKPLAEGEGDNGVWPCAPVRDKYIAHFPETREIWSYGSGYGGNALLGKKCLALRIASVQARDEGWMAEHMLILKLTSPKGESRHIAGAFPSACGKTNLAMLIPTIKDWKVETVGDDIAWMKFGTDGRLYAINPESGFFGVAPGTSMDSNPNAMHTIAKDSIFTNVALTEDGDIWWEGIGYDPPGTLIDWKGNKWNAATAKEPAAHPNARFTARAVNCPAIADNWEDPAGVPIDAFLFGGRRTSTIPLVNQATDWVHGTFVGSAAGSEITAAALDLKMGTVRRDPMAMRPFIGYHVADFLQHWLNIGKRTSTDKLPKIFFVNWFRKTKDGRWLWPGFGDNSRVLEWVFRRCAATVDAVETAIGLLPRKEDINIRGTNVTNDDLDALLSVDIDGWKEELVAIKESYNTYGDRVPKELLDQIDALEKRLG